MKVQLFAGIVLMSLTLLANTKSPAQERGFDPESFIATFYDEADLRDSLLSIPYTTSIDFRRECFGESPPFTGCKLIDELNDGANWSVRWQGLLIVPTAGEYTLRLANVDDGARVFLNGDKIVDNGWYWPNPDQRPSPQTVPLTAGDHEIIIHYEQRVPGAASLQVRWAGPGFADEVIPVVGAPPPYQLAVFYAVPSDIAFSEEVHQRLIQTTLDIQAWYQVATGGLTWALAFPEIVRVYNGQNTRQYYLDNGDWWGSLPAEMASQGLPIWSPETVTTIWAHGAGWWAGAAQGCAGECGLALLGIEAFPEFNNPDYSGDECPGGVGVDAWPCTPVGAFAHELGHTLGLIHPADDPELAPFAGQSIMQTHWNYPNYASSNERPWGFLTAERTIIRSNPFMHTDISIFQVYPNADVVNLPDYGPVPETDFNVQISGNTVTFINNSLDATLFYWTFGDGDVSNDINPTHTYSDSGTYTVILRASSDLSMMGMDSMEINMDSLPTDISDLDNKLMPTEFSLFQNYPNPFNAITSIRFGMPKASEVKIAVSNILGQRVTVLLDAWKPIGYHTVKFDASELASGLYFYRIQSDKFIKIRKMILMK